ncbi:MAG: hypothetical protein U1A25_01725 [Candidatus Sungbacteria bacterium]|nr:hypothetical protein [bacterium]MDZ4260360.1 hypothetical protein [Candidatus Sungbacteria bacterium]
MAILKPITSGSIFLFIYACILGGGISYVAFRTELASDYPIAFVMLIIVFTAMVIFTGLTVFTTLLFPDN